MGKTTIEWTDEVWNPVVGCDQISPGCANCYAKRIAERFAGLNGFPKEEPFQVALHPERLTAPLGWKKPRMVFVNSMSDLFHEDVSSQFIRQVFAIMAMTPRHTYQILTKRPERMRDQLELLRAWAGEYGGVRGPSAYGLYRAAEAWDSNFRSGQFAGILNHTWLQNKPTLDTIGWPLPNVWIGVSVENQRWADERIPLLLQVPAAVRFLSCEPLLGPLDLAQWLTHPWVCEFCHRTVRGDQPLPPDWDWAWQSAICPDCQPRVAADGGYGVVKGGAYATIPDPRPWRPGIHQVIAGGESGPGARPMNPEWVRSLRDQCRVARVPYFFKQWGEWAPRNHGHVNAKRHDWGGPFGSPDFLPVYRIGKKKAGALLDGREWRDMPTTKEQST